MDAEEAKRIVLEKWPDANIYGYAHGKVRIQSGGLVLSDMCYKGTREDRRDAAWIDAAQRIAAERLKAE